VGRAHLVGPGVGCEQCENRVGWLAEPSAGKNRPEETAELRLRRITPDCRSGRMGFLKSTKGDQGPSSCRRLV
jgi:hypothetical protein